MVGFNDMEEFRLKKQEIKEKLKRYFGIEDLPLLSQIKETYDIQSRDSIADIENRLGFLEEDDRLYISYYFLNEWLKHKVNENL